MKKIITLIVIIVFMTGITPNKSEAFVVTVPATVYAFYTSPVWVPSLIEISIGVVSTVTTIFVAKKVAKDVAEATIMKRTAVRAVTRTRKDGLPDARFNRTEAQHAADQARGGG